MDNWRNIYGVGHQHTRRKKRYTGRHVDVTWRNRTPQWWGCRRDPSSMRKMCQENPCEWKICCHKGTIKTTRIAHVLDQRPSSTRRNYQDIQRHWWNHTKYDDRGSQRTRIMQKRTKYKSRSNDHWWLSSKIEVVNPMVKMVNWDPWTFGNDYWSQWHCTVICDPS